MDTREIAEKNGFNQDDLERFLRSAGLPFRDGLLKMSVKDEDVDKIVKAYNDHLAERERLAEEKKQQDAIAAEEEAKKKKALGSMLITSGFSFDGYTIKKYSGYISGDDAVQIDRGREGLFTSATDVGAALMQSLSAIRRNALQELKAAAYDLGCNAVIGVDFDYLTLDPETVNANGGTLYQPYVFGVTANGNAVIIEKNSPSAGI